ncbi:hypothetical protein [Pendulispora albinea]|uniref:Uncharacterized protein n=1 Tax=Pendulispora albinea TaxID=2741071 RepID=A0ABZ2M7J5_9BACT
MISTRRLEALPDIPDLIRITKGLATLDAILCAERQYRYYSFNRRWNPSDPAEMMASMRDGCGDEFFILFSPAGAAIKGFAHESFMSPHGNDLFTPVEQHGWLLYPGMLANFPDRLRPFLAEPAFVLSDASFVVWRRTGDSAWRIGDMAWPSAEQLDAYYGSSGYRDADGSEELLSPLAGRPEDYVAWASEYFEVSISVADAAHVLALRPLDHALLLRLGSERSLAELRDDLDEIGYPLAAG